AERFGQRRFARSGIVFEQDMTVGEHRHQDELADVVAAAPVAGETLTDPVRHLLRLVNAERGERVDGGGGTGVLDGGVHGDEAGGSGVWGHYVGSGRLSARPESSRG